MTVIGKFELDLTFSDGSFEGTCTDEALKDILHEPISIRGFTDGNKISFIKSYPVKYYWNRTGNSYVADKSPGHEVEYYGEYDEKSGNFKGTWQIEQTKHDDPLGAPFYQVGKWLMHRPGTEPEDLDTILGQFFDHWQQNIFPYFSSSLGDFDIATTWLAGLEVQYVVKMEDHFNYLFRADLKPGTGPEEVHQLALNNLANHVRYMLEPISDGFFNITTEGMFEAEMILHPTLWQDIAEELNDDLLVSIPDKGSILLARASDLLAVSNLKATAEEQFRNGKRKLSDQYFKYQKAPGQWRQE